MKEIKISQLTTNRIRSTESYFNEVNANILTADEEVKLFQQYRAGDKRAGEKIIEANLRFVISVAKQYASLQDPDTMMDMIQEGNMGLIKAAEDFDITKGFKFISYAVWHIRQRIVLYLSTKKTAVRYAVNIVQDRSTVKKIMDKLEGQLERTPSEDEVFEEFKTNYNTRQIPFTDDQIRDKVKACVNESGSTKSLDDRYGDDDSVTMYDFIEDKSTSQEHILRNDHNKILSGMLLKKLPARERELLEITYGLDGGIPSLNRAGEVSNLTPERVRQINVDSLQKLKKYAEILGERMVEEY